MQSFYVKVGWLFAGELMVSFFSSSLRFDLRCGFCLFFFYREGGSRLGLEILFVLRRLVSRILNRRGLVKYC